MSTPIDSKAVERAVLADRDRQCLNKSSGRVHAAPLPWHAGTALCLRAIDHATVPRTSAVRQNN